MKVLELKHATITLSNDDILIVRCKEGHIFEVEEVKEIIKKSGELTDGKKLPTLTIPGEYTNASKEALEFIFSDAATEFSSADAFLVDSLAHKLIGNFYLKVKKPSTPTRLFKDEKSAITWLKKVK